MPTSYLFEPMSLRSVTFRNRIGVSPMCQYSCVDGVVADWHLVHLGARSVGGAGLVMAEATAVASVGRISPADTGIWKDEQAAPWRRIAQFIADHGAVPGIQLAHAGWKASTAPPWLGGKAVPVEQGGWHPVGVGAEPFAPGYPTPRELTAEDIDGVCGQWRDAAQRALAAGFRLIEIHAAHGYLLHSFLSPLANRRGDQFGGSFENRSRLLLRIVQELRGLMPGDVPLAVRLSCTDWVEGAWTIDDSVRLARLLRDAGVDLIDCSSGGAVMGAKVPVGPGYQTVFAATIAREPDSHCCRRHDYRSAAGGDDCANRASRPGIPRREMLRDPYWPRCAARCLGLAPKNSAPSSMDARGRERSCADAGRVKCRCSLLGIPLAVSPPSCAFIPP